MGFCWKRLGGEIEWGLFCWVFGSCVFVCHAVSAYVFFCVLFVFGEKGLSVLLRFAGGFGGFCGMLG